MALFKILKGSTEKLPRTYNEGYMYITQDAGLIYLDTTNTAAGRICLNGHAAEALRKIVLNEDGSYKESLEFTYDDLEELMGEIGELKTAKDDASTAIAELRGTVETAASQSALIHTALSERDDQLEQLISAEAGRAQEAEGTLNTTLENLQEQVTGLATNQSNLTLALEGDVEGQSGDDSQEPAITITTELASILDESSAEQVYGPASDMSTTAITADFSGTINIPHFTVDQKGRITEIQNLEITLPSDDALSKAIADNATAIAASNRSIADNLTAINANRQSIENNATAIGVASDADAGTKATGLHQKIEDETARAVIAENNLQSQITQSSSKLSSVSVTLSGDVAGSGAITDNIISITTNISDIESLDSGTYGPGGGQIANENQSILNFGDSILIPSLDVGSDGRIVEATNYQVTLPSDTRITNIESAIGSPSSDNTTATGLHKKIEDETARAIAAENTLTSNLASEESRAKGVENALDGRVGSLETRTGTLETDVAALNTNFAEITVTLSGDMNGSADIADNTVSIPTTLKDVLNTSATYGPATSVDASHAATTLAFGGTVNVPHFTTDTKGRITAIQNHTITLPSDTELTKSISDNASAIAINAENIAKNKANIESNDVDIAKNAAAIQANADAIGIKGTAAENSSGLYKLIYAEQERAIGKETTLGDVFANHKIQLSGDVTSAATSLNTTNNLFTITTDISNSGVDKGTYGPSGNATLGFGDSFSVSSFSVESDGRISKAYTRTFTLPSDSTITQSLSDLSSAVANIQGNDGDSSMREVATDVVNQAFTAASIDGAVDKISEIVQWINADDTGAIDLLANHGGRITKNEGDISDLQSRATTIETRHSQINVALSGDVKSTNATINTNNKISLTLDIADSGVTTGTYGQSSAANPGFKGTFTVPKFTVAADGRITSASHYTVTMPSADSITSAIGAASNGTTAATGLHKKIEDVATQSQQRDEGLAADIADNQERITDAEAEIDDLNGRLTTAEGDITTLETNCALKTTSISAGTGLTGGGTLAANRTLSLATSGVTAGTYGPSAAVTGSNGATMNVPQITVDSYGRITSITNRVYTAQNTANTDTKNTAGTTNSSSILYLAGATSQAASPQTYSNSAIKANCNSSGTAEAGSFVATKIYGAVWNDFAEYRESDVTEPGRVICENGDDTLSLATVRLQPGASVVSDTFGFAIGETDKAKTPIAVAGRVLAYTYENRYEYKPGDAVCAAPGGTVSKMTREEIMMYPERIVGVVSAIPEYETWGENNAVVNGRIWVKVK